MHLLLLLAAGFHRPSGRLIVKRKTWRVFLPLLKYLLVEKERERERETHHTDSRKNKIKTLPPTALVPRMQYVTSHTTRQLSRLLFILVFCKVSTNTQ